MSQRWGSRIGSIMLGGLLLGIAGAVGLSMYQFRNAWTPLQRYWLSDRLGELLKGIFVLETVTRSIIESLRTENGRAEQERQERLAATEQRLAALRTC